MEKSSRLRDTSSRKGRVNFVIPPTISFSLHINYSSQLGMSSGPYAVPYALNYISIVLKIQETLNFPDKYLSFTATNELDIDIHTQ